jgi:hypothetical protein
MTESTEHDGAPEDEQYDDLLPDQRTAQWKRLVAELEVHPGSVARERWGELARSQQVWRLNMEELKALLEAVASTEELKVELIQNVRPPAMREAITVAIDQRLHNMLAGATSLVDHARNHLRHYDGSDFATQFEARNKEVAEAPTSVFLRRLRNFLVHVGHAPIAMHAEFPTAQSSFEGIQLEILLDSAALLEWDGWGPVGRAYVQGHPDGIPLATAVEEYRTAMLGLNDWVNNQYEALHRDAIDGANDLVRRINLTMTSGLSDGRDSESFWAGAEENLRRFKAGEPQLDARTGKEIETDFDD